MDKMQDLKRQIRESKSGITGFNYAFSKALVEDLKKMIGTKGYKYEWGHSGIYRSEQVVVSMLCNQMNKPYKIMGVEKDIKDLIEMAEKFLAIFEDEEVTPKI